MVPLLCGVVLLPQTVATEDSIDHRLYVYYTYGQLICMHFKGSSAY